MNLFKSHIIKKVYIQRVPSLWGRHLIFSSGSKIDVTGIENIPTDRSFCLLSNHQSNFDIPILLSILSVNLGFIGKHDMRKLSFFNTWMKSMNSTFIKRNGVPWKSYSACMKVGIRENILLLPVTIKNSHLMFEKKTELFLQKLKSLFIIQGVMDLMKLNQDL